jgi:hypothetical protein
MSRPSTARNFAGHLAALETQLNVKHGMLGWCFCCLHKASGAWRLCSL